MAQWVRHCLTVEDQQLRNTTGFSALKLSDELKAVKKAVKKQEEDKREELAREARSHYLERARLQGLLDKATEETKVARDSALENQLLSDEKDLGELEAELASSLPEPAAVGMIQAQIGRLKKKIVKLRGSIGKERLVDGGSTVVSFCDIKGPEVRTIVVPADMPTCTCTRTHVLRPIALLWFYC